MAAATTMTTETFDGPHDRERERPVRAELMRSANELVTFYTSSLGVSAQPYESSGGSSGVADFDKGIVRELDDAAMNARVTRIGTFDAVRATLAKLPFEIRQTLARIYEPWGTGFVPSRRQTEEHGKKPKDDTLAPDFLSIALAPKWGGGSFVRLAILQPRTHAAFEKQYPTRVKTHAVLLQFLVAEAGRGQDSASFFRKLQEDCSVPRDRALQAYDAFRVARVDAEAAERRRRRDAASAASNALFEATIEARGRRARNRLAKLRDLDAIELAADIFADTTGAT